jgi:pimeloyl-ACP methyl ester carboxylesterase
LAREISEVSLEFETLEDDFDEADIDILDPEELEGIQDDRPHLVFLIPGIRTDGWWAQEARMQEEVLWEGREVHFIPVRGNGGNTDRLSSWHLLSRIGLSSFRRSFSNQINTLRSQREYASVNVFAHSMGSALFTDIVDDLASALPKARFDTVVFLGSVCHRKHAQRLHGCAELFVNDVGTKDYWPFWASTARPDCYSDVGFAGFLNGFAYDRFFSHNHTSCTSLEHLRDELVPLLSKSDVQPLGAPAAERPNYNSYVYFRRAIWVIAAFLAAWLIPSALF